MSVRSEATPNPNALKFLLGTPRTGPIVSAGSPEEAEGDATALALLAIPGVTRVLVHTAFVTVSKEPGADWGAIKRGVGKVLGG